MAGPSKPHQLCHAEVNYPSNFTHLTCPAEAANHQRLIPVMLPAVISVCKVHGLEEEIVGMGKVIYRDWVCLSTYEFNSAPHLAN